MQTFCNFQRAPTVVNYPHLNYPIDQAEKNFFEEKNL